MSDIKLTDFDADQLQTLLTAVMLMRRFPGNTDLELAHLNLWHVQILNAISTVKIRETTTNN